MSYSALNSTRSALSAYGIVINGTLVGKNVTVIRFMKGVFNLRPPEPKNSRVWDVCHVLTYLKRLSPLKFISFKDLTLKLVMLIALTTASRSQSLHLLTIKDMEKKYNSFVLYFSGLLKQSRPGWSQDCIELFAYPIDRRICVYFVLKEYLKRSAQYRKGCDNLFISYVKPHQPVSRDTISRWIKTVMLRSGINVKQFSPHSVRSASVSKASFYSVPIENILKVAGWSNEQTFAKFYKKTY